MIGVNKINYSKNENIIGFIYGLIILLSCQPYFLWGTGRLIMEISLITVVISVFYLRKLTKYDIFIIIPLFGFYFAYLYGNYNISGFIGKSIFFVIPFIKEEKIIFFLNWFKKIFVVSLIPSLLVFILIVFFFVPFSYNIIPPLNELKQYSYYQYPFLVSAENPLGFQYLNIRFCGMFDEPGVVGSAVTILLFCDNYNLKPWQNKILFIAGILSFSFFFIICSIIYYLYLNSNKIRLLFISLFLIFFLLTRNNDIIYYLVWDRLTIENGQIKGDNRSSHELNAIYDQFVESNDYYWGRGGQYAWENDLMGNCSYKLIVLNYGIIFLIVVCLSFILLAYFTIKKFKYLIGYWFLFLGMMYQRPGLIYDIPLFFLMISSIYALKHLSEKSQGIQVSQNLNYNFNK